MFIEKSDRSREIAPEIRELAIDDLAEQFALSGLPCWVATCLKAPLITGHECRRSLYDTRAQWHRVLSMNELRDLRRAICLGQREFAALLSVAVETYRTWDSGRRGVPTQMLHRARAVVEHHARQTEWLPLDQLANELHVHVRTLQAAVRTGRLDALFSVKSVFGRPMRFATRAAGERFIATHYRRFGGQRACPPPLSAIPADYDQRLRTLRRRLLLTQEDLALRIGAGGRAVVYQWESRKRTPSPVFWERILRLGHRRAGGAARRSTRGSSSPR
jgi:DNA-binding transcriptional regulator YiaG